MDYQKLTPQERAIYNARAIVQARERRARDPERVRALDRAKYLRRVQRDRAGFMAARRAQALRRTQHKKGADGPGVIIEWDC